MLHKAKKKKIQKIQKKYFIWPLEGLAKSSNSCEVFGNFSHLYDPFYKIEMFAFNSKNNELCSIEMR